MNKYIYAEATVDDWPRIKTIVASSYNEAVEKVINKYSSDLEEEFESDNWEDFREELNDLYTIALSDIEEFDEL